MAFRGKAPKTCDSWPGAIRPHDSLPLVYPAHHLTEVGVVEQRMRRAISRIHAGQ